MLPLSLSHLRRVRVPQMQDKCRHRCDAPLLQQCHRNSAGRVRLMRMRLIHARTDREMPSLTLMPSLLRRVWPIAPCSNCSSRRAAFATEAALRSSRQRWCALQLPLSLVPRRSTLLTAAARPAAQHSCHSAASEQLNRLSQLAGPQALAVPYGGSGSAGDRSSARVRTRRPMAGAQRPR